MTAVILRSEALPVILRSEATKDLLRLHPTEGRSFASLRACPELEGNRRPEESRSFAALRMTGEKCEGMTAGEKASFR